MPGEVPASPTENDKLYATDFIDQAVLAGLDFQAIGFNIASGVYHQVDDSSVLSAYLAEWNSLAILLDDPNVLGVSIGLYDYQESGRPSPFHWGLVVGTSQSTGEHTKRPAFDAVSAYWHDSYR